MPLSKLVSTSLGQALGRYAAASKTNTATKLPGSGNAPGVGAVGATGIPAYSANTTSAAFTPAQAGAGPQLSSAGSGGGVAADPRDPTYWTDVAKIHNTFGTNDASYNLQQTQGQTTLNNTLAQLDKQQPVDISNARGSFNNAGLFYSTRLTGAEGDINSKFETSRNSAKTGYSGLVDSLNILRNQNQNENGVGPNGELTGTNYLDALNAGIGRSSAADQALASQNMLAQLLAGGGTAPPPAAPQPGGMVNGQFQSSILSPDITAKINQWIAQSKIPPPKATSSKAQKTTGR